MFHLLDSLAVFNNLPSFPCVIILFHGVVRVRASGRRISRNVKKGSAARSPKMVHTDIVSCFSICVRRIVTESLSGEGLQDRFLSHVLETSIFKSMVEDGFYFVV